ncbi:MAG: hypothetical protein ACI9QL_005389, partial [Candidatus Omnitrophota bacterium]
REKTFGKMKKNRPTYLPGQALNRPDAPRFAG